MRHVIESLLEAEAEARRLVGEAHQNAAETLRRAREDVLTRAERDQAAVRDEAAFTALANAAKSALA